MKNKTLQIIMLLGIIIFSIPAYSQHTVKVQKVDSLVKLINNAAFKIQRDTLNQDRPEMGLSMRTYLTMVSSDKELKKFVNDVQVIRDIDGTKKKMLSTNTFYFDQSKLIKVEETVMEGDKKLEALWYYADDTPIYYTLNSDEAQARAELLLTTAKSMLEKFKF